MVSLIQSAIGGMLITVLNMSDVSLVPSVWERPLTPLLVPIRLVCRVMFTKALVALNTRMKRNVNIMSTTSTPNMLVMLTVT